MVAVPWTVCGRREHWVRRCHATCGTCNARRHGPKKLRHQLLRPAKAVSMCLAMDTGMISVEDHEPQLLLVGYAHVCSLHKICLRLNGHDAFALQWHWRHIVRRTQQRHSRLPPMRHVESDIWWQRPVHDGHLHRVTPLHGDARCSSASPFQAKMNCSPTRAASAMRGGCVDSHDAQLRTHQNVIAAASSPVPVIKEFGKSKTNWCKHFA